MSETANIKLPLLAAAQAQKHVTVNEAITRIDAALQISIVSRDETTPPLSVPGDAYLVATGSVDGWAGRDGEIAFAVAAGWDFLQPKSGWRIWVASETVWISFDGTKWITNGLAVSTNGAGFSASVIEFDEVLAGAGTTITTSGFIPASTSVLAVTGIVIDGFDGGLSSWALGVGGSDSRYGSGLGAVSGSWMRGLTGQPQSYYADTPLLLTSSGGNFGNGRIRLAIHLFSFGLPRSD